MTFEELISRVWRNANDGDRKIMRSWTKLCEASMLISDASFQGTKQDLRSIFDLLDADGNPLLSMADMVRSCSLTKAESQKLLEGWYNALSESNSGDKNGANGLSLTFHDFCVLTKIQLTESTHTQIPKSRLSAVLQKCTSEQRNPAVKPCFDSTGDWLAWHV